MVICLLVLRVGIYLHASSPGPPQMKSTLGTENNNRNNNINFISVGADLYYSHGIVGIFHLLRYL